MTDIKQKIRDRYNKIQAEKEEKEEIKEEIQIKKSESKTQKPINEQKSEEYEKKYWLKEEAVKREKKEKLNEDIFRKTIKNSVLDISIVSNNKVVDHFKIKDIGQDWIRSVKLNRSYFVPDRSEGFSEGFKTIFYYDANNISPLTALDKEEINEQNVIYTYGRLSDSRIKRFKFYMNANKVHYHKYDEKTRKIVPVVFKPTTMDSEFIDKLLNTTIVNDFLKIPEDFWETMKVPIIVGCIALVIIVMMFTM